MGAAQIADRSKHVLLRTSRHDGHAIVEVEGLVDVTTACDLGRVLSRVMDERDEEKLIVVDLSAADLIDSAALATLLFAQKHARRRDGDLVLAGLSPKSRRLLQMTGLDRMFKVIPHGSAKASDC
jgi:anti-anti-sigma factor